MNNTLLSELLSTSFCKIKISWEKQLIILRLHERSVKSVKYINDFKLNSYYQTDSINEMIRNNINRLKFYNFAEYTKLGPRQSVGDHRKNHRGPRVTRLTMVDGHFFQPSLSLGCPRVSFWKTNFLNHRFDHRNRDQTTFWPSEILGHEEFRGPSLNIASVVLGTDCLGLTQNYQRCFYFKIDFGNAFFSCEIRLLKSQNTWRVPNTSKCSGIVSDSLRFLIKIDI